MTTIWSRFALIALLAFFTREAAALRIGFHETNSAGANAASITVTVPANVRAGDVMVAVVLVRNGSPISASAAWTAIRSDASGTNLGQALFYRVVTGAEPTSYTFNVTSARVAAAIVAYRGVELSTPVAANVGQANASSTTITAPTVNTGAANAMLVSFFGTRATTTVTGPGTMTERVEDDSGGTGVTVLVADEFRATAGLTGTRSATAAAAGVNIGQSIVLAARTTVPSPVAEYRLDEMSWSGTAGEVADSSGNGLNGTALGGAQTTTTNAYLCRSGRFTGTPTRVDVPDNSLLDIRSTLTVTAWIRPGSIPATELMSFLSKDTNYEFHIATNGRVNWWWGGGTQELFTANNTVAVNQWTFVAFVFVRGNQTIYVGGPATAAASAQTGTDSQQLTLNTTKLQIGDDQDFSAGSRRWNGLIDEVRIYDYALTQSEVESVRSATRTCPSLLAGFAVTSAVSASTCVAQSVTIRAVDSLGATIPSYTGTVTLTTSAGRGGWAASPSSGPVTENGNANDGIASYTFRPVDSGQATLLLTNQSATDLTVTATDSVVVSATGVSGAIAFRDNAFVIDATDVLANVPVAGRPHAMRATLWRRDTSQSPANCAIADTYTGLRNLKAWTTPDGSHPPGATAPGIAAPAPGTGLAALPAAVPGANNLALQFTAGQATFNLTTADVGKYVLNLRDDSRTFAGAVDINGSSSTLTVRPFAIALVNVSKGATTNPGGTALAGSRFVAAGDTFAATVGGYLWSAADDADNDGAPDASSTNVVDNGLVPRFAWASLLAPASTASPFFSPAGGALGALTGTTTVPQASFGGGAATASDLRYSEVGSIGLDVSVTGYLNTVGVDLVGTAVTAAGQPTRVGRFHPDRFVLLGGATVTPFCGGTGGFTYMGQPAVGLAYTIEARSAQDALTTNYRNAVYAVGSVSVVAENADNGINLSARLTGLPATTWSLGSYAVNTPSVTFSRLAAPDGPFEAVRIGVAATDPDGAVLTLRDLDPNTAGACGGGCTARALNPANPVAVRFGRLRIANALGSPTIALPVSLGLEYWNGTGFVTHAADSCTRLTNTDVAFSNAQGFAICATSGTPNGANAIVFTGGRATNFRLSPPQARGSVDLTVNLATPGGPTTCVGGASAAATTRGATWLQSNWGTATYDRNPTARASFGQFSNTPDIIYLREQY